MQKVENIELVETAMENSELGFKPNMILPGELINENLKSHQITTVDWKEYEQIKNFHLWAERFIFEFKLKTSIPAIMIGPLHRTRYGHYRPGRNGFGLLHEIAINQRFVNSREYWDVLGTLLHELLHLEQKLAGKPGKHNYHNKAYKERAASFGLIVDQSGHMQYAPAPSPFWDILAKYGIVVPEIPTNIEPVALEPGHSKLKLWICNCKPQPVRVRVAIEDFQARCLKCGTIFHRVD